MMTINKRFLQFIAALWILIFHLWINLSGTIAEQFVIQIGYVAVDLFFFMAAYSLADKELEYLPFLKNRFVNIYLKFVIFAVIMAFCKGWDLIRAGKVIAGIELFEKGGGAFLWFLPALMVFYLVYPAFLKWNCKYKIGIVLLAWFVFSLASERVLAYNSIFIFTNRIPVILAGYVLKKRDLPKWVPFVCLPLGVALLYFFGFQPRLNVPFYSFYFVLGIVLVVAIAGLSAYIPKVKIIDFLGSVTLEIYAVQMVFGFDFAKFVLSTTKNAALTDFCTILFVWIVALAFAKIYKVLSAKLIGTK